MLIKLHPGEQRLVTDICKSKLSRDLTIEINMRKVLIFNDGHNKKTRILKEKNDQAISLYL